MGNWTRRWLIFLRPDHKAPFGLSLSKPCPSPWPQKKSEGFDKLSPNGGGCPGATRLNRPATIRHSRTLLRCGTSRSTGEERVMIVHRNLRFLLAAAAFGASSALLASPPGGGGGGGGGGSAPSMSGQQYDAAAEYRKGMEAIQAEHYED